jgi:GT2 family glycosyltransferase
MKTAVVIASTGRAQILHETVAALCRQSQRPDQLILSIAGPADMLEETRSAFEPLHVVSGPKGIAAQRNTAVRALRPDIEVVLFMDDDAELRDDYVEVMARAFEAIPELVLMSGRELADGCDRETARLLLSADRDRFNPPEWRLSSGDIFGEVWGSNMAARRRVLDRTSFDERLPLYAWMEDFDFALQCARHGRIARVENCRLVHLNTQTGRVSPARLGFSQTMNPVYIWRKGYPDYPARLMLKLVARMIGGNIIKLPLNPIHRLRRLKGSLIALAMVVRRDFRPERMTELS